VQVDVMLFVVCVVSSVNEVNNKGQKKNKIVTDFVFIMMLFFSN